MSGRLTPVVLDTNIASQRYKKRVQLDLTRLVDTTSVISFVTYAEMCKWALVRDWAPHNLAQFTAWLDRTPVIDSGKAVSTMWGQLAAAGAKRGRPRPENDTWIAACCLVHDLPLATLNVRDFQDFVDHHGLRFFDLGTTPSA